MRFKFMVQSLPAHKAGAAFLFLRRASGGLARPARGASGQQRGLRTPVARGYAESRQRGSLGRNLRCASRAFQMTANFQRWTPTKAEADLLVDMLTARLAPAKIAKALYIDVRTLRAYLARLSAAAEARDLLMFDGRLPNSSLGTDVQKLNALRSAHEQPARRKLLPIRRLLLRDAELGEGF
jgi:hypothetical protein